MVILGDQCSSFRLDNHFLNLSGAHRLSFVGCKLAIPEEVEYTAIPGTREGRGGPFFPRMMSEATPQPVVMELRRDCGTTLKATKVVQFLISKGDREYEI